MKSLKVMAAIMTIPLIISSFAACVSNQTSEDTTVTETTATVTSAVTDEDDTIEDTTAMDSISTTEPETEYNLEDYDMEDYNFDLNYDINDARFCITRHTDTYYPTTTFSSKEEVDDLREELKFNLRMAAGLYPWPEKTEMQVIREDVGTYDGYKIQKIMFETYPGLWSTGNLYLPDPMPEKAPAILNLIGHWGDQRLTRQEDADYPQQLANFAKMGFICLVTDMIGMVDSRQVSHSYGQDDRQQLWLSNGLGIQLWNNIRAMDLLCSMPEVDAENIGVTGASGGGTQTLLLSLLDERVKAAAPINMMSLHYQGGCQCEHAAGLRRHTNNIEMCAMLAPRALFLAGSTGDWTNDLEKADLPAVLESYRQYGAENMVEHFYQNAGHQYNAKTRHEVYNFFARHLMGKDIEWKEQTITYEQDLWDFTWYNRNGRAPGIANDQEYYMAHKRELAQRISALSDDEKRKMLAWIVDVGENTSQVTVVSSEQYKEITIEKIILRGDNGEEIPVVKLTPSNATGKKVCLALSGEGKDCLKKEQYRRMLAEGTIIVSGDLFQTGESADYKQILVVNGTQRPEPIQQYHTDFNNMPDAFRVQDVCLLAEMAAEWGEELTIYAEGSAARAAACALPLLDCVSSAYLEQSAVTMTTDRSYVMNFYIPGICAIGGLSECLELVKCEIHYN